MGSRDSYSTSMKRFNQLFTQRKIFWIFAGIMLVPNIFLCLTEPLPRMFKASYILLPGALYLILLLLSRKPGIMFWTLFPLHFISAFQLVLLHLFGNSIIASDMFLNLFTTNQGEAFELLHKLAPAVIAVCLLYIPALVLAGYSIRLPEKLPSHFRRQALSLALLMTGSGLLTFIPTHEEAPHIARLGNLYPINALSNARFAVKSWKLVKNFSTSSQQFDYQASSSRDSELSELYVLVIGETSRAKDWGLYGYERNTTPRLSAMSDLIHFDDMLTQINATHKSVPLMLCPADALDYNEIYRQKSLITAFRQAGFHTAFLSNQLRNGSFTEFFADEADYTLYIEAPKGKPHLYDTALLPIVDSLLNTKHTKQLIILHTYGSHFNYCERYPRDCRTFTPDHIEKIDRGCRQSMINAYDNSIVATDKILAHIIDRLRARGECSAMLYISDHGEDLLDDRRNRFLHASPMPTYYQLHVPCALWLSPDYIRRFPQAATQARSKKSTPMDTRVIFHTLLDIGGIDTGYLDSKLSLIHPLFHLDQRYYVGEQNRAIPLHRLPWTDEDYQAFERHGITCL